MLIVAVNPSGRTLTHVVLAGSIPINGQYNRTVFPGVISLGSSGLPAPITSSLGPGVGKVNWRSILAGSEIIKINDYNLFTMC